MEQKQEFIKNDVVQLIDNRDSNSVSSSTVRNFSSEVQINRNKNEDSDSEDAYSLQEIEKEILLKARKLSKENKDSSDSSYDELTPKYIKTVLISHQKNEDSQEYDCYDTIEKRLSNSYEVQGISNENGDSVDSCYDEITSPLRNATCDLNSHKKNAKNHQPVGDGIQPPFIDSKIKGSCIISVKENNEISQVYLSNESLNSSRQILAQELMLNTSPNIGENIEMRDLGSLEFDKRPSICGSLNSTTLILLVFYILISSLDLVTELVLAGSYCYYKDYKFSALTFVFAVLPTILMILFRGKSALNYFEILKFMMDEICFKTTFEYALKTNTAKKRKDVSEQKENYNVLIYETANTTAVKFLKNISECSPQLIIQLSILLFMHINDLQKGITVYLQLVAITLSIIVLTITIIWWDWSIRLVEDYTCQLPTYGIILQFAAYFLVTVSRMLSISLLASVHPYYSVHFLLGHWLVTAIFIYKDTDETSTKQRISLASMSALVFTFLPVSFKHIRGYIILFSIFLVENICITIFWYFTVGENERQDTLYECFLYINYFSFVIGCACSLCFYRFFTK